MLTDSNIIIRTYLAAQTPLTALVSTRIYGAKPLPEGCIFPAIQFFTRGGQSDFHAPGIVTPSVQFKCFAADPIDARAVYNKLYDALQGIGPVNVTVGGIPYTIFSSREEVQGQDLQDPDDPNLYCVLTFFSIMIRAD